MATNLKIPTGGLFRAQGDNGDAVYYFDANGVPTAYSLATPGHTANDYDANRAALAQYGIDWNSLPTFNRADVDQRLIQQGKVNPSNGMPVYNSGGTLQDLAQLKGTPAATTDYAVDTDPSVQGYQNPNQNYVPTPGSGTTAATQGAAPAGGSMNPNAALQTPGAMGTPGATVPGTTGSTPPGVPQAETTPHPSDATLQQLLASSTLSPDMKAMIQAAYDAVASHDIAKANQLIAGFNAATQFSDPYFKTQVRIAVDALQSGISANEGDLAFKEQQQKNALDDLVNNTAASKDYLDFQKANELKGLQRDYETNLDNTQNDLASRGLTSSSIRSRSEQLLGDNYNGMVESQNRSFANQQGALDRALGSQQRDTAQNTAYYQSLADQNKLDLLRKGEEQVGSATLEGLGYSNLLGGVGGQIPQDQVKDALSFANSYV